MKHVSTEIDSWKPTSRRGINSRFRGYEDQHIFPLILIRYITGRSDQNEVSPMWRRGTNISTVALRVVGGDENGSLESETVKYGRESQGTRTRE
jgi:hypothetical protein